MKHHTGCRVRPVGLSAFAGFRFPPEVIMLAIRWYLRYNLSYRDLEELLAERGIEVDHVTLYRWVQRFTPLLIDAARPCRHAVGRRWFVDETFVKVSGVWRYVYRAVDNEGQIIDVFVSSKRDIEAATKFFAGALLAHGRPVEVVTDKAPALANVIEKLLPMVHHNTEQYANNRVECDHGRLKARLRRMRGLKTDYGARSRSSRSHVHPEPSTRTLRTRKRKYRQSFRRCCCIRRTHHETVSTPTIMNKKDNRFANNATVGHSITAQTSQSPHSEQTGKTPTQLDS
jgi:transposase, IS6 family